MLWLLRFLWTGDYRLPQWEKVDEIEVYCAYGKGVSRYIYVMRDKVSGRMKTFKV